jgi:glycosyltransferase involved in cell wall biosynthesis/SAM-dependent methyltransferase
MIPSIRERFPANGLARRTGRAIVGKARRPAAWSVRLLRRVVRKLTLFNARANARAYWPGVHGLDLVLLAAALAATRYQLRLVELLGKHASLWRERAQPHEVRGRKILHVTCSFDLGGTQTQIRNLCQDGAPVRWTHDVVEIFPESNYLFRQHVTIDPQRYMGRGPIGRTLGRLVANIHTRSMQAVQIYQLVRDIRAARPDVVVGWGHELCVLTFIAAAFCRTPHIVFCVRTFNPGFGWMLPPMDRIVTTSHRRMLPYLSGVIVNSTALQRDYAAWAGINPAEISVCANGIDMVGLPRGEAARLRAEIRARYSIPADAAVIVHVGRFSGEKGQMSLVKANAELRERLPGVPYYFILCGDGPTMPEVQAFASAHSMSNVVFAGRTTEVRAFLAAADIFVMPSDFEGMPNAMMEAMAEGLPCVSSDRSGALDIARDRQEALYYPPRDVEALARHLELLIRHPDQRLVLGRRAQVRMKEFSVARFVERFERLIDSIVDGRAEPAAVATEPPATPAASPLPAPSPSDEDLVPVPPPDVDGFDPYKYPQDTRIEFLEKKVGFLLDEVSELRSLMRHLIADKLEDLQIINRTARSFDYQWRELPDGRATVRDENWKATVADQICRFTDLPREWFAGRKILDAGCGGGRWTYGFGSLGASKVLAFDVSEAALRSTRAAAEPFGDRVEILQKSVVHDLDLPADFDLVWCFGVLHHTGRTYQGFHNIAKCVRPGGYLFVMLYGEPRPGYRDDYAYYHEMATLRAQLRTKPFEERARFLEERYGQALLHGYFDAVSPEINDLYRWDEILIWYLGEGFEDVHRTNEGANHYAVGRKRATAAAEGH